MRCKVYHVILGTHDFSYGIKLMLGSKKKCWKLVKADPVSVPGQLYFEALFMCMIPSLVEWMITHFKTN